MKETIYVIETKKNRDGTVTAKNGFIYTPKIRFTGGNIKWYEDKYKNVAQ